MKPEEKITQLSMESTVWLNLNEEENPVAQVEEVEYDEGIDIKIEQLNFQKPSNFGNEKYVQRFSDELLQRVLPEDEFRELSAKRKKEK